jgi:hypothetical protein
MTLGAVVLQLWIKGEKKDLLFNTETKLLDNKEYI